MRNVLKLIGQGEGTDMKPRLYTVQQFAELANLGETTVWKLIKEGEVESVKIGDLRRIPDEAVDSYIEKLRARASQTRPAVAS